MEMNIQKIIRDYTSKIEEVLGDNLSKVILYGSYARGDQRENSDIDLMVLTTLTDDEIREIRPILFDIAFDFEMEYFIDISVIIKNEEHFRYWLDTLPFYRNVEREGVVLNG